jgi:two-component SAPR family response regulator
MIELLYKGKNWFLEISSAVNFDYLQYLSLSEKINNNEFNSDYLKIYINTVKKGGLLPTDSYKWLDGIKYEINEKIIIDTQKIIENIDIDKDSQIIIELCDIIFSIDPVYESALISKIRALSSIGHFGAMKKTYEQFYEEYKVLYDEKYPLSFDEIVKKAK